MKYCDLRVISSSYLQRTTLEQELGLAAYLVRAESRPPHDPGPGSDLLESDADKLSSTDNEEEEAPDTGTKRPLWTLSVGLEHTLSSDDPQTGPPQ